MSRHCRFCHTPLTHTFADLGLSPLSNSYVKAERLNQGEVFYPLHAWVCPNCQLVQLEEFEQAENIFNDEYAYFSSYSSSWLAHARLCSMASAGALSNNRSALSPMTLRTSRRPAAKMASGKPKAARSFLCVSPLMPGMSVSRNQAARPVVWLTDSLPYPRR
mgnify:FL=1